MQTSKHSPSQLYRVIVADEPQDAESDVEQPTEAAYSVEVLAYREVLASGRAQTISETLTLLIPAGLMRQRGELFQPGHRLFVRGRREAGTPGILAQDAWFDRGQGLPFPVLWPADEFIEMLERERQKPDVER